MAYTNSPLVNYTKLTSHKTNGRTSITGICIHCMAGNGTVESCGNIFLNRNASSNYGVDSKGRIGMYVEEKNRSWCTSSGTVDNNCITIEVANDGGANTGWHVNNNALKSLILLCADICKRNGFRLKWNATAVAQADATFAKTKNRSAYKTLLKPSATHNMPAHRWVQAKACPGQFLYDLEGWIAQSTNHILDGGSINDIKFPSSATPQNTTPTKPSTPTTPTTSNINYQTLTFNGVNLAPVYNATFYYNNYPDLQKALGTNQELLFKHFCTSGMNEARKAIATFDPKIYRKNYPDLDKAYGDSWIKYYSHYCTAGMKEGRKGI